MCSSGELSAYDAVQAASGNILCIGRIIMTDREFESCMSAIERGDREGLRRVYDEYLKLIFAVVYDTIGQREEAEDITSEFFIKLYKIAGTYRPGNGHKRWLVTIAKNMAVDRVRKLDRELLAPEQLSSDTGQSDTGMADRVVESVMLKEAAEALKADEREVLDLKVVGGFTFREIAELKGKPLGTVTWLYNQAINKLRRCKL